MARSEPDLLGAVLLVALSVCLLAALAGYSITSLVNTLFSGGYHP